MTVTDIRELTITVAQLRHAYANLKGGHVGDQAQFADGLISPQIESLERLLRKYKDR
jgi:hypothetical protein